MADSIIYRPFQETGISKIVSKFREGFQIATANPFPGSGKTALSFGVAIELYRLGMIDAVVHANPRLALCGQFCEDWLGRTDKNGMFRPGFKELYDEKKFKAFTIGSNPHPFEGYKPETAYQLICTNEEDGYSVCFNSLISDPKFHADFASYRRTFLILDEAQYLGVDPKNDRPTNKFAEVMDQLSEYYPYVLVMGGTSRGNSERVWGVEYTAPNEDKQIFPLYDVTASYKDGVAEGYLRDLMFKMPDAEGVWNQLFSDPLIKRVSKMRKQLGIFLKDPQYYQHLIDLSINELQSVHQVWNGFGMLVAAFDQDQAKSVEHYLNKKYPHLKTVVAVSKDGAASLEALRKFKDDESVNVLITVRQAFIGYSCNRLLVLCCLTNYREWGFLDQLLGRVLRVRSGINYSKQVARVIMPCDLRAIEYAEAKKQEAIEGLKIKEGKNPPENPKQKSDDDLEDEEVGSLSDVELLPYLIKGIEETQDLSPIEAAFISHKYFPKYAGLAESQIAGILREGNVIISDLAKREGFIPESLNPDKDLDDLRDEIVFKVTGSENRRNSNSLAAILRARIDRSLSRDDSYRCAWRIVKKETGIDLMPKYMDRTQLTETLRFLNKFPSLGKGYLKSKINEYMQYKASQKDA